MSIDLFIICAAHRFVHSVFMAQLYHNDLLAPFLALDQGGKVQAECTPFAIQPALKLI
jgi:hypothetical protein